MCPSFFPSGCCDHSSLGHRAQFVSSSLQCNGSSHPADEPPVSGDYRHCESPLLVWLIFFCIHVENVRWPWDRAKLLLCNALLRVTKKNMSQQETLHFESRDSGRHIDCVYIKIMSLRLCPTFFLCSTCLLQRLLLCKEPTFPSTLQCLPLPSQWK